MLSYEIGIDWGQALSDELPAGPDMQYTPEFAELEAAATGTPEQEYGDVLIPAKAPEWQRVLSCPATYQGERTISGWCCPWCAQPPEYMDCQGLSPVSRP